MLSNSNTYCEVTLCRLVKNAGIFLIAVYVCSGTRVQCVEIFLPNQYMSAALSLASFTLLQNTAVGMPPLPQIKHDPDFLIGLSPYPRFPPTRIVSVSSESSLSTLMPYSLASCFIGQLRLASIHRPSPGESKYAITLTSCPTTGSFNLGIIVRSLFSLPLKIQTSSIKGYGTLSYRFMKFNVY